MTAPESVPGAPEDQLPSEPSKAPTSAAKRSSAATRPNGGTARLVKAGLAVGSVIVIAGGYAGPWRWTGFPGNSSLWDWLHLVLLPVTFGALPLWLKERHSMGRARQGAVVAGLGLFAVLVALGIGFNWTWTGFPGNTLWEWLELLVLPAVVVAWPVVVGQLHNNRAAVVGTLGLTTAVMAVLIAGGYELNWTWTGFAGNTLWDWLELVLLPAILPWWILPSLSGWMEAEIEANQSVPADPAPGGGRGSKVPPPPATDRIATRRRLRDSSPTAAGSP